MTKHKLLVVVGLIFAMTLFAGVTSFAGGVGLGYQDELLYTVESGVLFVDIPVAVFPVQGESEQIKDADLGVGMQTEAWKPNVLSDVSLFSVYRIEVHDPLDLNTFKVNEFDGGLGVRYEDYALDLKVMGLGAYTTSGGASRTSEGLYDADDNESGMKPGLGFKWRASLMVDFVQLTQNLMDSYGGEG